MIKPAVVLVDAANINERRIGEYWSFKVRKNGSRKYSKKAGDSKNGWLQIWSYDHFEHCLHRLEENVPGAVIICFFDEYSIEKFDRSATPDDKQRLIEAWSREDYVNGKILKVPKEFKADHPLVELAQKLDAFVITADRFDKPGDPGETQEWRKSEKLFFASFYKSQEWVFENQKVKDDNQRSRLLKHEIFGKSFATESELVEILKFAENFLNEWLADPRNDHLRRPDDSESLSQNIDISHADVRPVAEPEEIVRAYRILKVNPEFKKYQWKYVKVQGRLKDIGSALYIEWFANYLPIRIEPVDEHSFIGHRQRRNFVEVKGELNESSGHPVLKSASFVRDINFENLQTPIPKTENLTKSIPKNYTDKNRSTQKPREEPRLPEVVEARHTQPPIPPPPLPTSTKRRTLIDRKVLIGLIAAAAFVYLIFGESIAKFFR